MKITNLLIIESPNKIAALKKYLDGSYEIVATVGHIRDLPRSRLGFDEKTYDPQWLVPKPNKLRKERSKSIIIKEILSLAKKVDNIYLASDPDREGEAIAWHVYEVLPPEDKKKAKRVTFNEISKDAVLRGLDNARQVDENWVQAQFARRILDRMIGYPLSEFVKKVAGGESAGRVQSVALKFIEDREKEIENFVPTYWWTLDVVLKSGIPVILRSVNPALQIPGLKDNEEKSGIDFEKEEYATKVKQNLGPDYTIYAVDEPEFYTRSPREPYKTSTLQQDAVNKLNWQAKKIMLIAQKLYEGSGTSGEAQPLISYPRTDSVRISEAFEAKTRDYIASNYGEKYVGEKKPFRGNDKVANVQDAHEAIRPIDIFVTPNDVKDVLPKDEYALYKLIWNRTIASMMSPAKYKREVVRFINNENKFYAFTRQLIFDGFTKIYGIGEAEDKEKIFDVEKLKKQKVLQSESVEIKKHETKPAPRYTQATLVAELEKSGVGRPSTYSTMANVAVDRGYANLVNRAFVPTVSGRQAAQLLDNKFPEVINAKFTSAMESKLDQVAEGTENWKEMLRAFWPEFQNKVKDLIDTTPRQEDEKVGEACPDCGKDLVYKMNRNRDRFIGCSGYPNCRFIRSLKVVVKLNIACDKCGKDLVERTNKRGQKFAGCSGYPSCRNIGNIDKDGKFVPIVLKKENPKN